MNKKVPVFILNFDNLINLYQNNKNRLILTLLSGVLFLPMQMTKSEEVFLKCIGKYEINRGALIKPDWETSYLTINLDGLVSTIDDKGIELEGRTLVRRNSYTITHRDDKNIIKNIYKINRKYNTYTVVFPQWNRTLIGTCQKGRG